MTGRGPSHGAPTTVESYPDGPRKRAAVNRTLASPVAPRASRAGSARIRILVWYVLLVVSALVISLLATRQVLIGQMHSRVDGQLRHEVNELRGLAAGGINPTTGRPFSSLRDVLQVVVGAAAPEGSSTLLGYLDGRPYVRSRQSPPVRLDTDPQLTALWGATTRARLGSVRTAAGEVRYAAVPVTRMGDQRRGVVVAVVFIRQDLAEVGDVTRIMAESGLGALLIACLLAWLIAGRLLAPVRHLTELARTISDTDLTRRIPVHGRDEISQLASTFNGMMDRLEEAFRAQRAFVDDAGHELRTPLTIIRGNLELLASDPDHPERQETMAVVADELDRVTRMVTELLTLAKSEQPNFLQVDLVEVENLTAELMTKARALGDRRWRLERAGAGVIIADRQRLTQAVMELAQNAAQHTDAGETIEMGTALTHGEARFWVRDTGPGVAVGEHERIFARFARADHRRDGDGAGLGLSIVRTIAEAHGGRVELSSRPSAGATFTLIIPAEGPSGESRLWEHACQES